MKEFENIVVTAYLVIFGILLITIIGRYYYFKKTKSKRIGVQKEIGIYKIIRYGSFVVMPIFVVGIINFVFVLSKRQYVRI